MRNKERLYVCENCLRAIVSREGKQSTKPYCTDIEDEYDCTCDWCKEDYFDELYELIPE